MLKEKNKINNVILSETKNLIRSFTCVQDDNQRGRSMVEMLGVLAVIGVLSVAGIAGYNNAMNKHRANELLNEASKRAAIVAMQAAAGQNLNLGEFSGQPNADLFTSVVENPANTQQFQLTLSEVDEKVCTQMRSSVGTNTPIRDINSDCTLITYNKDLSTTVFASDYNADTTGKACTDAGFNWCSKASTPSCQADCCADFTETECQPSCNSATGEITNETGLCDFNQDGTSDDGYCKDGACLERPECTKEGTSRDYTGGVAETLSDGTQCKCPANQIWTYWGCVNACTFSTTGRGNGCNSNEFCYWGKHSDTHMATLLDGNVPNYDGVCRPLTDAPSAVAQGHHYSTETMDWWTASSWCYATAGSPLMTLQEVATFANYSDIAYIDSPPSGKFPYNSRFYINFNGNGPMYTAFCGSSTPKTCISGAFWLNTDDSNSKLFISVNSNQDVVSSSSKNSGGKNCMTCGTSNMKALCRY